MLKAMDNSCVTTASCSFPLIFAPYDTTVLDQTLMRRDQVWFVEKDEGNATRLYPLSDYKPRKGEALQKGYLYGRYGALPFAGEI